MIIIGENMGIFDKFLGKYAMNVTDDTSDRRNFYELAA